MEVGPGTGTRWHRGGFRQPRWLHPIPKAAAEQKGRFRAINLRGLIPPKAIPLLCAEHDNQSSNTILGQKVQNPANWPNTTQRERALDPRGETRSRVGLWAEEAPEQHPRIPGCLWHER